MADAPLPPGFTAQKMAQAQRAFESALGAGKVFFDELDRQTYQDKFYVDPAAHHPVGAVAPESVEEVQTVVRIANQYLLPLWPISRGKNLGYGGSAPLLAGSVVLDMSRMKGISFDEQMGTVVVEPGVGFYDLYDFIKANKLPYWMSTPGNSWGSVMGNALDRGMGYTPFGEHAKNIVGLEVVL
ncbi:MAG TPA: FAD-dependent oxidoreductase, partial [Sphingomonadaceae bacterium]|nr:FAD-dependent oxidoreductase [Sphingomonadaceae bacterium]